MFTNSRAAAAATTTVLSVADDRSQNTGRLVLAVA